MTMRPVALVLPLLAMAVLAPARARAHGASTSYLTLRLGEATGSWDIAVRDLDDVLALDGDGDGAVRGRELRARLAEVVAYAAARIALRAPHAACGVDIGRPSSAQHADGAYVRLPLAFACPEAEALRLEYQLLFERDAQHRGLARVIDRQGVERSFALGPAASSATFPASPPPHAAHSSAAGFVSFLRQGVQHIWGGLDHVLFLLALLIPAVSRCDRGLRVTVGRERSERTRLLSRSPTTAAEIRAVVADVATVVTAFTAAHSLTLSLSTLGVLRLPPRLIESAIAASVALAALSNLKPVLGLDRDRWVVAFALGLLHGFGFSSALGELGLQRAGRLTALLAFNAGVEAGQLAIVAVFVPLAFLVRRSRAYRYVAIAGGSAAIAVVSFVWLFERLFDFSLIG